MNITGLPNTLSGLLRVAVEDAQKCEIDPRFKLDMKDWVTKEKDICCVCMAGAVLVQSLQCQHEEAWKLAMTVLVAPKSEFDQKLSTSLRTINLLRRGQVYEAAQLLNVQIPAEEALALSMEISWSYLRHKERAPWVTYLAVAKRLEAIGL